MLTTTLMKSLKNNIYTQEESKMKVNEKLKREYRKLAKEHTAKMAKKFKRQIEESAFSTISLDDSVFGFEGHRRTPIRKTDIAFVPDTSENLVMKIGNRDKILVLDFANFTKPGGGFIRGSIAQEESLCHSSNLYNILMMHKDYYKSHRKFGVDKDLATNDALFIPDVKFNTEEPGTETKSVNVLVVAAPNAKRFRKRWRFWFAENSSYYDYANNAAIYDRINFVLKCAEVTNQKILVLGAFGCGVFGQRPTDVAEIFRELLDTKYKNVFKKVYFPVPYDPRNNNYTVFKQVFTKDLYLGGPVDGNKTIHEQEERTDNTESVG